MYDKRGKSRLVLFLFLLVGMLAGASLGDYLNTYSFLEWLSIGYTVGIAGPVSLSLGIFSLTFGFTFKINVGSVFGLVLGILAYKLSERI